MRRAAAALAGAAALAAGCSPAPAPAASPASRAAPAESLAPSPSGSLPVVTGPFPVVRVSDGDTLTVAEPDGDATVRVLGIDTPETHDPRKPVQCYGPEASANAKRLLTGRDVYLEADPTQDVRDRYGRVLAYVWVEGRLLELEQLRGGYAREYTYRRRYARQGEFRAAQAKAKAKGAGLWGACAAGTVSASPTG